MTRDATAPPAAQSFAQVLAAEHVFIDQARSPATTTPPRPTTSTATTPPVTSYSGLALSGGGIRSATFCLGVVQAIAKQQKLGSFDYLSTVSGGGYLGSFLSAWIHRKGIHTVQAELSREGGSSTGLHEAKEVTWLRQYSNYLAPKLGMLSADSMTLVATWTRNVLLNLVVVVSLFACALLFARCWVAPGIATIYRYDSWAGLLASFLGFFVLPLGISYNLVWQQRPHANRRFGAEAAIGGVAVSVLAPALVAAFLGSLAIFSPSPGFREHLALSLGVPAGLLLLVSAAWTLMTSYQLKKERKQVARQHNAAHAQRIKDLALRKKAHPFNIAVSLLASVAAFVVAAALIWYFVGVVRPEGITPTEHVAAIFTFGPPALLITFGLSGSVFVGIIGRSYFERSREWWSRLNAWLVTLGIGWFAFFGLVFYALPVVDWAVANSGDWIKAAAGAGWLGSLLAALLVPKPGSTKTVLSSMGSKLLDLAATVVMVGFLIGVAYGTSAALRHVSASTHTDAPPAAQAPASTELHVKTQTPKATVESSFKLTQESPVTLADTVKQSFDDQTRMHAFRLCARANPNPSGVCELVQEVLPEGLPLVPAAAALMLLVFLLFGWRVDVNKFSLHNMYKNRLIRCYLGASRVDERNAQPFTGFDEEDDLDLSSLAAEPVRPLHIVNTALNLTQGSNLAWQERKAASFTFTALHCGFSLGPSTGDAASEKATPASARATGDVNLQAYRDTRLYASQGDERRQISLGATMATSGAAVSPNMGHASTAALAFVLTLFNVRIGRWSANPHLNKFKSAGPKYGVFPLLSELFGFSDEKSSFVYLSDGGHFDNTGVYELVRRRCATILAVDAGADFERSFNDLADLVRKCRIDFGYDIQIDVERLGTSREAEGKGTGFVEGRVDYKDGNVGRLIVIKPTLLDLKSLGVDVFSYARGDSKFPQQSTSDQFFDESQFESYRALGETIATACLNQCFAEHYDADDTG